MSTVADIAGSVDNRGSAADARHLVRRLITKYTHLFTQHQWPSEHLRWTEFVFAFVSRLVDRPESEVRSAIEYLDDLELLQITDLADIVTSPQPESHPNAKGAHLSAALRELAFTAMETEEILTVLSTAARAIRDKYDGGIQHFLRKHGELMAQELLATISPTAPRQAATMNAIRYWLQNVADMPIVLSTGSIEAFAERYGLTEREVTAEADRQELNIALLDDMINQALADEAKGTVP